MSIIELWHCALNVAEEIKPERKDSIEISQIILSLGGWKRAEATTMTRWGKQRYYVKDLPYFPF